MEIQWTRMAGQWPVEASPLVGEFSQPGQTEILVLNRGGQLMLWSPDGTAVGPGQDGFVTQLPEGRWTTAPMLVDVATGARLVVVSVEGLVVALDQKFKLLWQHKLSGETGWGRATAAKLQTSIGQAFVFGDQSGTVSCLTPDGLAAWTNAPGAGPIKSPPQTAFPNQAKESVLIAAGSTLFYLDATGHVRWRRDLDKEILTRPEVLSLPDQDMILCGTSSGSLFSLSPDGKVLWECPTPDLLKNRIASLPRADRSPLILCAGLWGNLHAIDIEGRHVWTHLFRAKTRATPLVLDVDGNGHREIFISTFHQHVFAFDENGGLLDDVRLSGIRPSALTPIIDSTSGRTNLLVTTTTLLAYRLRPGPPKSPYGKTGRPQQVGLQPPPAGEVHETYALQVRNPQGALINVNLSMTDTNGWAQIASRLTARSAFEIPLPSVVRTGAWLLRTTARDAAGQLLDEKRWLLPPSPALDAKPEGLGMRRVWATPAYGEFDETQLAPLHSETAPQQERKVILPNLYLDEADQGAFIIASTRDDPVRARIVLSNLRRADGAAFAGTVVLREVIATGSVNGELVPDALPKLDTAGLVTIPPHRSAKIWVSVDARSTQPGNYTGHMTITPLQSETNRIELPLAIEVLNLRLPEQSPLT